MRLPHTLPSLALVFLALPPASAPSSTGEPSYDGKPLSHWVKQLQSTNLEQRQDAAVALEQNIGPEGAAAVPALIDALGDPDVVVCSRAAGALARVGPGAAAAVPALIAAFKDGDRDFVTRVNAGRALGAIGPTARAAIPTLIEGLKDKDSDVRTAAADGLGGIGPDAKEAIPHLVKALKGADVFLAGAATDALGHMGEAGAMPLGKLYDEYPESGLGRAMVASALSKLGPKARPAVPALIKVLKKSPDDRWQTTGVLAKIGPAAQEAIPALLDVARGESSLGSRGAAYALYRIDPMAAAAAGIKEPPMTYELFLNAGREYFDKEQLAIGGGEKIDGRVTVWLNGDPVTRFEGGGLMMDLGPWLRPGTNELTVTGAHKKPAYTLVAKHQVHNYLGKVGKKIFDGPGGDQPAAPLVFTAAKTAPLPDRETLGDKAEDRARYEKEIRNWLTEVKKLIRAHDGKKAAERLYGGLQLWQGPLLGITAEEAQKEMDDNAKVLADPKLQVVEGDAPPHFLFGKRLVWVDAGPPAKDGPYLLGVTKDGKREGLRSLQLARVAGEWVVWYAPGGVRLSLGAQ